MKKIAIMQPYFFPYIGYFQLISSVDYFIIYDNIKYTKKGWINRNRIQVNGEESSFSIPLKKDSDSLDICQRVISTDFSANSLLNRLNGAYKGSPYFDCAYKLIEKVLKTEDRNLFKFLHHSIEEMCHYLGIETKIIISSDIQIDHNLKAQDKVLAFCKKMEASTYINAIGGVELYDKEIFRINGLDLKFIKSLPYIYPTPGHAFIPWLSIIDVMMFNSAHEIKKQITEKYVLV